MKRLFVSLFVLLLASASQAQNAIPTPDEFLGYTLGERFTPHAPILDYFHLLTTRSNLITMHQFGETYEHRPLMLAVITSPKNRAALETIRANVAALTDPNATTQAASRPSAAKASISAGSRIEAGVRTISPCSSAKACTGEGCSVCPRPRGAGGWE